jgi:hypothetical protein
MDQTNNGLQRLIVSLASEQKTFLDVLFPKQDGITKETQGVYRP